MHTHLRLIFCLSFVSLRLCLRFCLFDSKPFCFGIPNRQRYVHWGATTHSNPHINIYNIPSFQILLSVTTFWPKYSSLMGCLCLLRTSKWPENKMNFLWVLVCACVSACMFPCSSVWQVFPHEITPHNSHTHTLALCTRASYNRPHECISMCEYDAQYFFPVLISEYITTPKHAKFLY